jgi:17beta-estradiol 17-dehydrogenase / very-long-chain 3-oxoacyl-CoA reductase
VFLRAVITGCTDGIGLAYTEYVAKKGLNIVLISRSEGKLKDLSDSLTSKYKIETKIIVANFAGTFLKLKSEKRFFLSN